MALSQVIIEYIIAFISMGLAGFLSAPFQNALSKDNKGRALIWFTLLSVPLAVLSATSGTMSLALSSGKIRTKRHVTLPLFSQRQWHCWTLNSSLRHFSTSYHHPNTRKTLLGEEINPSFSKLNTIKAKTNRLSFFYYICFAKLIISSTPWAHSYLYYLLLNQNVDSLLDILSGNHTKHNWNIIVRLICPTL